MAIKKATPNADKINGGDGNDIIDGLGGDDTLSGAVGNDSLMGGIGKDTLDGGTGNDTLLGGVGNDSLLGGSGDDKLSGDAGNDTLEGSTGKDTLDGGFGDDRLVGGAGNDLYKVDSIRDQVVETDKSNSVDTVQSSVNYTLLPLVEHLELLGMNNLKGSGNALNNRITGNAGDNALDGLAGQDTLTGGDGADTLNGGAGNDSLSGGAGDDIYIVGSSGDRVIEKDDDGEDEIQSSVSFTLANAVEMLTLTGSSAVNGIGNALDNLLNGNTLANQLSGEEGNDTLVGNAGDDTLAGGAGDDQLDGGAGNDMVIYAGNYADYQFTRDEEGDSWTIQAVGDGDDGTDILTAVELVKFADITKNANELDTEDGAKYVAPVFISASVNANILLLNYADSDALDIVNLPAVGAFTVTANGVVNAVTAVAVTANTVALTLAKSVTAEQLITVAYSDPTVANDVNAIQDEFGNDAASLAAVAVVNETAPIAPTVPTYSIAAPKTVSEGATANFTVATTNVANGTALAYTLSGVNAADVSGGLLTGYAVVNGGAATIPVALATDALFGETDVLGVTLAIDPTKTASVVVTDTTLPPVPTYSITAPAMAAEGATANFTVTTTNVANGTALAYSLSGVDAADVIGGLTGFATVTSNMATIAVALATDALFGETDVLGVTLTAAPTKTVSVVVTDTTLPPVPTYAITAPATASEGATANFTVATTNIANGTALAYTLSGVDAADVAGGVLTGYTVVTGNTATIPVTLANDALFGETDVLGVTLAIDPTKTASVVVTDTTLPPVPTYSITAPVTAAEGATANFTVATTNVANGTALAYTLSGVNAADVTGGLLTGYAVVNGNAATIPVTLANDALFGETDVLSMTLAIDPTKTASVFVTDTTLPPDVTPPVFSSLSTANAAENQNLLYTAVATDPTTPVTYTLTGTDAALLDISATGAVMLTTGLLDFDATMAKRIYSFNVVATDSTAAKNATTLPVTVTVTDAITDNDTAGPTFTSFGAATAAENQNLLYTAVATDATTPVTYSLYGMDAALLDISATGAVTLKTGQLDFDAATAQKIYSFNLVATDLVHNAATLPVTVNVTDDVSDNLHPITTLSVTADNTTPFDATTDAFEFVFSAGNYTYNISGFNSDDMLNLPDVFFALTTINNESATDGRIIVIGNDGAGSVITINLTGVLDTAFSVATFNTAFGEGSLI